MAGRKANRDEYGLTDLERVFIDLWLIRPTMTPTERIDIVMDLNPNINSREGASAVVSRIINSPHVIEYCDMVRKKITKKVNYTKEKWFADAIKLKEMAMGEREFVQSVVIKGKREILPSAKYVDLAQAKAALEMIGRSNFLQLFKESLTVDASEDMKKFLDAVKPTTGPPALRKDNPDLKVVK